MLIPVLLFALGLVLLIKGGDWFVDGATGIAERFHVPEIIIGATVVSIGTTLPEVMVSATSALTGHGEIAYGNAIGSIICNTALIAALTVAIRPGPVDTKALKTPVLFFFGSAAIYVINAYVTGYFGRPLGILLLAIFVVYLVVTVRQGFKNPAGAAAEEAGAVEEEAAKNSLVKDILLLVIGAALVAVGADLDRLHRPRPQWGMLGLTLALLLVGGWLRYALTRAGAPWDEDLDPLRCALSVVTGAAVLVGAYFLDVSRLLRWAKWVYIGAVAVGVLSLHLSPTVNNASYFTRYVVLFYPAVYALWLYACRGKGWRGLLAAVAGGIPLTVVCMCAPFIQGMIQVMVIGCFLLLLAIQMDWFTVPRRQGLAAVGGLAAVMTGAVLWLLFVAGYNAARIQILLHPEIDPQGAGYQAVMARRILGASRLMGKGGDLSIQLNTVQGMELPPEMMLPEWNHDFLPTTMVYKLGWLPYLLLLAVLAVLLLWMLRRCACQQSQSGKLLALAVVLTLAVQSAFAAALNLGFVLFSAQLPLVTGNLHSMVDCALIGLALSAFRSESILRDAVVPVPRPPQTQTA